MTLSRPAPADLVIDTSAIVALLRREDEAASIEDHLDQSVGPLMSAATLTELLIVTAGRRQTGAAAEVTGLLDDLDVVVVPVDHVLAAAAHRAWERFGKGRHRAALNYGDCFTYALAAHTDLPILCVGRDFEQTDLIVVPTRNADASE